MSKKSAFGANPEQLQRLLTAIGLEESNADEQPDRTTSSAPFAESLPGQVETRIDRYKLLRVLGEGGMGMVYLAEQQGSIRRRVALKAIKPGMDSKRVLARFEAERQALALLDHPNIAQIHDAGTAPSGRPYFVMEYVKGVTVTEYCDRHTLSIEDRLRLFQQVCHAVHHAHPKGIIHRDIKPSNILVTTHEDQAVPKIIDFGVAKAVIQPLTERTLHTEQGQLFGTPEYMSPEQADMTSEDIDTRSDIYSLGVLLYVLLTGVLPFDSDTLREGGIEHIRQIIRETDPKTPSTRLTNLGEEAKKVAQSRQTEIAALAKKLHKELEWIPLKAMRKERSERYRSASEFADDIENYLKGNPLIAGPLTALYQLKKFMRRNRALVAGTLAVFAVSVIGAVVSLNFAFGQMHARAESEAVTDFLQNDVLASVGNIRGRDATMDEILDIASQNLENRFEDQPLVEASIRWTLGMTYHVLGDNRAAIRHLERVSQILREQPGKHEKPTTDIAMNYLAVAYFGTGQYTKAERLFDELIEARRRQGQKNTGMDLWYKCNLAHIYKQQGRYEEAEQLLRTTLENGKGGGKVHDDGALRLPFGGHV
jgi:eukaryotic-like serine/threonine-protein kinase